MSAAGTRTTKCKTCGTERDIGGQCRPCKINRWRMRQYAKKGIDPSALDGALKYKKQTAALLKSGYVPGKKKRRNG